MKKTLFLIATLLMNYVGMAQETYRPTSENLKAREQFQDEKFGIFLHWGLYSMMGAGEWVMNNRNINYREYPKLAKTFYPSEFDADAWVRAIKAAGAKYITITTRHHDGFSLFKTSASTYNTVDATPFRQTERESRLDKLLQLHEHATYRAAYPLWADRSHMV